MNFYINKFNNAHHPMQKHKAAYAVNKPSSYLKNNLNFGTSYEKIVEKGISKTYTNIDKIAENIDEVLGDKFFSNTLKRAQIDTSNGSAVIKEPGFLTDFAETLKYPFAGMPLDIANWALRGLEKTPFKKTAQTLLDSKILSSRAKKAEIQKSYNLARDILDKFSSSSSTSDIEKCTEGFKQSVAMGITKISKNYNSRDERTLNRAVTSTVSALYSANDFYNISLLQKDDTEDAKKAQKARFKQEMTRMALSAGLTFFTLGALERYVKNNIIANSLVIALSALISEVVSRVFNGTPLHPLSPEEAAKIAKKKKEKKPQDSTTKPDEKPLAFKNRYNDKNFIQFAQKDGTYIPMNHMLVHNAKQLVEDAQGDDKNKKHKSIKTILGISFAAMSSVYLLSRLISGKYSNELAKRNWYIQNREKIDNFLSDAAQELDAETKEALNIIKNKDLKLKDSSEFLRSLITEKNKEINLDELKKSVEKLKNTQEGSTISSLLDKYLSHIQQLMDGETNIIVTKEKRFLIPGIYDGVTKIIKMIYQIFSLPAAIINGLINKNFFEESSKAFKKADKKIYADNGKLKKEILELYHIIKKSENNSAKATQQIKRNIRNFETGAETGELANISRTMVTLISTYFFVNDYTNKVLIESEGRNVQKAKEESRDRIAHKMSNFVINGTLMNLFNSIFKVPLNRSLVEAAGIAAATEATNEFMVRKSICQPFKKMKSKQDILDYEEKQLNKKGLMGLWSKTFRKLTGKKTLTQKAGVDNNEKKIKTFMIRL